MTDISASQALGAFAKGMSNVSDEWSEYDQDMKNMDPEDNVLLEVFRNVLGKDGSSLENIEDFEDLSTVELVEIYEAIDSKRDEIYESMPNGGYVGFSTKRQETPLDTPMDIIKDAIFSKLENAKTEYGEIDYEAAGISEDGEDIQGIIDWIEEHGDDAPEE